MFIIPQDIPLPPRNVTVLERDVTTARVTWIGALSRVANISYSISITSSCPMANNSIPEIFTTSYTLSKLCPNNTYSIAVRAHDMETGASSPFSDYSNFFTLTGEPSQPRFVNGFIDDKNQLTVTWVIPAELNAVIAKYEIRWSLKLCNESEPVNTGKGETNPTTFEFVNILEEQFSTNEIFSVCVRAVTTDGKNGTWGIHILIAGTEGGLRNNNGEDCNTLITVACVAGLTVASSLLMSIILSISVVQKGWFCLKVNDGDKKKYPK